MAKFISIGRIAGLGTWLWPCASAAPRTNKSAQVSILSVWRDALAAFSVHPAPMLLCAFAGFAAPVIIGQWIATQAVLRDYVWVRPVVTLYAKPALPAQIVLAIVGLFAGSFARGVITWLASADVRRNCEVRRTFAEAVRITVVRYPSLLFGILLYSFVIAACMLGTSVLARGIKFDPDNERVSRVWTEATTASDAMVRQIIWHGFSALTPDPGPPFAGFMPEVRAVLFRQPAPITRYAQWLADKHDEVAAAQRRMLALQVKYPNEMRLITVASVMLLVVAETLLRFRTVMVFEPLGSPQRSTPLTGGRRLRRFTALIPLIDSGRFGLRHFGIVTLHVWATRFVTAALVVCLVEFPIALVDYVGMPHAVMLFGKSALLPILKFAQVSGTALVGAVVLAFGVVYDARLAMRLEISQSAKAYSNARSVVIAHPSAKAAS